jgi:hypothetical protein
MREKHFDSAATTRTNDGVGFRSKGNDAPAPTCVQANKIKSDTHDNAEARNAGGISTDADSAHSPSLIHSELGKTPL